MIEIHILSSFYHPYHPFSCEKNDQRGFYLVGVGFFALKPFAIAKMDLSV